MINTDKSEMSGMSSNSNIDNELSSDSLNQNVDGGNNYSPKTSVGKMLNMDQMNSFSTSVGKRDEHFILPKNKDV